MQAWENIAWDSLHSNSSVWKLFQKRIHLNQDSSSCSTCQTYVIHESEFKWSLSNASPWKALIWIQAPKEKKGTMQPSDLNQDSSHCGIRFQARFRKAQGREKFPKSTRFQALASKASSSSSSRWMLEPCLRVSSSAWWDRMPFQSN